MADGSMTPAEHLAHAHAHTVSAGQHAGLAATHIQAAHAADADGDDGGAAVADDASRAMPVVASPPQAGYAQNRTSFAAASGAARSYRAATRRR